jgi:hypothetical protein
LCPRNRGVDIVDEREIILDTSRRGEVLLLFDLK